jgi:hypothetical protein
LDAQNQVLSEDGRFEFRGVPRVDARLHVRVRGYRFARETDGYSEAIGFPHCAVAADREAGDLRLVLEPGDPQPVPVSGKPKP